MIRPLAGWIAVAILKILARLPLPLLLAAGSLLLPFYAPFRGATRARLRQISPLGLRVAPLPYYRMRLRLALLSLKHLFGIPDSCTIIIEGRELYRTALASGNPVVILGWHQGPVELLHRVPQEAPEAAGRPRFLMTAKAFAPALTRLMQEGRSGSSKEIVHPHSLSSLRRWEKENGILALMMDQVPGVPEEWLSLFEGKIRIPYPVRLLEWLCERDAEFVVVSVRLVKENRILFRYDTVQPRNMKNDLGRLVEEAIRTAPEQYNWSYPKVGIH